MTIRQSKALLVSKLTEVQMDAPAFTAGALLCHILQCSSAYLYTHDDGVLTEEQEAAVADGLARLMAGEPLDYILGQRGFMGLDFYVGPGVLVPRADTETLVELCLDAAMGDGLPVGENGSPLQILDLCTGSGCIAISLTKLLQERGRECETVGVDFSKEALAYARKNRTLHQMDGQIQWILGDVLAFEDLVWKIDKTFHIVTINPPYIPSGDVVELEAKVREYEPLSALDGGEDGLSFYRVMAAQVHRLLKPDGYFACEIGFDQGEAVAALFAEECRYTEITIHKDYAGKDRVVTCRFPST